jgi:ABC-type transport system involved in multi-copper enzyme maturation permease subunit
VKAIALAHNTFREGVRDRLYAVVGVFGGVVLVSTFVVGPLSLGQQVRITQDIGLASISILGLLIAVLVGTGIVYREIEKKTIYTVLSKPMSGWEFIAGKFLGLVGTVGMLVGGMTLVFVAMNMFLTRDFQTQIIVAILLVWMELVLLISLSVLMSTLCSPILGAIFTFMFYVIGHASADLKELAVRFGTPGLKAVSQVIYYVLPNLEYLNVRGKAIHGVEIGGSYVGFACAYALLYSIVFLIIAVLAFERREFK